ncbi:MAG: glycosyltransferase family 4 protein [Terriglobales bacterium]
MEMEPVSSARLLKVGVLLSGREQFSPFFGGALARWTYEVYSRLRDRVDVTVFGYPTSAEHRYGLPHGTSGVWKACDLISTVPVLRRWDEPLWLRGLIKRLRPLDVVHIHNRPQWVRELRGLGYEGAIWLHLHNNHLGHWTPSMLDTLAPQVDGVAACSAFLRGTFAERSPNLAAKTRIIFNGVNLKLFYPREEIREAKTILFAGRFDEEKGVLQLVRAYACVLDRHPDAVLAIVGTSGFGVHRETEYVRRVREMAQSLVRNRNAHIHFPGYIHHDRDLPAWFQRATVVASPSLFEEPFGMVNAEAMACGTPVVGSNRGGIPEVVGETGILVNPENVEELAGALSNLLDSVDYRSSLGRAAQERCREIFDWDIVARQWFAMSERGAEHLC